MTRPRLDSALFRQHDVDTTALTMNVAVIHAFAEAGRYDGLILQGEGTVGNFALIVDSAEGATQADIDLDVGQPTKLVWASRVGSAGGSVYRLAPNGYGVFHVGGGMGGFAARLGASGEAEKRPTFDTRSLEAGDLVAVTLLRPGRYEAVASKTDGHAWLTVAYPDVKAGLKPAAPISVSVSERGFEPAEVFLVPTQGLLFQLNSGGQLKIALREPDDGPQP